MKHVTSNKMSTTEIGDLPNEMLFQIFGHLGIKSLVKCRSVCKRWQIWADQIKLKELFLFKHYFSKDDWNCNWNWFYTANSIDKENAFFGDLNFFQSIPFNLDQLKRLKVYNFNSEFLEVINKLIYLEHLELVDIYFNEMEMTLNLPILKILYIDRLRFKGTSKLIIEALMLKCFTFYKCSTTHFKILNPGSITYLEAGEKVHNLDEYALVEVFKMIWRHYVIDKNIIKQLPNLREFHLQLDFEDWFEYEAVGLAMNHILEQKVVHGKHDLKVYFLQHLLEPVKKFEDYDFHSKYNYIFCNPSSYSYFYLSSDTD